MSEPVTRAEFARIIGRDRAWVTRLAQAGRLKLAPDGRVLVEESKALIEQTRGSRDDVIQRHEEKRQAPAESRSATQADPNDSMERARRVKAVSEARRSAAAAEIEELERDRLRGSLIAREDVDAALKFAGATLRGEIERLADQLAPLVAPVADLEECRATIEQAARDILARFVQACERQAAQLGRPA